MTKTRAKIEMIDSDNLSGFLKGDGSGNIIADSSTYLTVTGASNYFLPLSGGTVTGSLYVNDNLYGKSLYVDASTPIANITGYTVINELNNYDVDNLYYSEIGGQLNINILWSPPILPTIYVNNILRIYNSEDSSPVDLLVTQVNTTTQSSFNGLASVISGTTSGSYSFVLSVFENKTIIDLDNLNGIISGNTVILGVNEYSVYSASTNSIIIKKTIPDISGITTVNSGTGDTTIIGYKYRYSDNIIITKPFLTHRIDTNTINISNICISSRETGELLIGNNSGFGGTCIINSNFIGNESGYNATIAQNSNFIGNKAGYNATCGWFSNYIGQCAGYDATKAYSSNFLGYRAGQSATNAHDSNFLGCFSGWYATNASYSNFLGCYVGYSATGASNSNFLGYCTGSYAYNACNSNFLGNSAGCFATNASYSNFLGNQAGRGATNASCSNFIGQCAGYCATNASYSTLIGLCAGARFTNNNIGSNNIIIGTNITLPSGRTNSMNLGGVIFACNTYATTTGNPSIAATSNGLVGIGTATPTKTLSLGGNSAQTIWMERHTTAANGGKSLTLQAGGAYATGTNLSGGTLCLSAGISTGNVGSCIRFFTASAGSSGSADNTPTEKLSISANGTVTGVGSIVTCGGFVGLCTGYFGTLLSIPVSVYCMSMNGSGFMVYNQGYAQPHTFCNSTAGSNVIRGVNGNIISDCKIGIATLSPTYDLSFGGNSSRVIWLERNAISASAGNALTIQSGGAYSTGTNLLGGDLQLKSGIATGCGTSNIRFYTATAGSSGTADVTPTEKLTILGSGNVGINSCAPTEKFEINGNTGRLFTVSDCQSGVLFQVSDISGIPLLTVDSNGYILQNSGQVIGMTGATNTVYQLCKTVGSAAYIDYRVSNATTGAYRAGTVTTVWDSSANRIDYTEVSTPDLYASTAGITLCTDISGNYVRLIANISSGCWNAKIGVRAL